MVTSDSIAPSREVSTRSVFGKGPSEENVRVLVAIANYGVKNVEYAKRVIQEYRAMPFDVDIFVLSEAPKDYGDDVKVLVGLPSRDPWTLPFAHKKLFADNARKYDLFIYAEDDTLIRAENILAFMRANSTIGQDFIPGFLRYELDPTGKRNYPDIYSHYHWDPASVATAGDYTFARFSNEHAACYVLTQQQLQKAIASGGFLVPPHSGRYDLICSAGTDPYTQCGLKRVLCFSHLREFEVHHMSNIYVDRIGLDEDSLGIQVEALVEIADRKRATEELFVTEKPVPTSMWDKSYYEPCRDEVVELIPPGARDVLSVGCGWGATEAHIAAKGRRVTAIPLDSVIATLAERRGIRVLPADLGRAIEQLGGQKFDAIVLSDVLQHFDQPAGILRQARNLLKQNGAILGSVPNLSLGRRLTGKVLGGNKKFDHINDPFEKTRLHLTSVSAIKRWLKASDLDPVQVRYHDDVSSGRWSRFASYVPKMVGTRNVLFVAKAMNA
jgi:2-polyprenyl-3-methyl-5-hydroxy-6-metoxy-1,4-benzoquinol methylase